MNFNVFTENLKIYNVLYQMAYGVKNRWPIVVLYSCGVSSTMHENLSHPSLALILRFHSFSWPPPGLTPYTKFWVASIQTTFPVQPVKYHSESSFGNFRKRTRGEGIPLFSSQTSVHIQLLSVGQEKERTNNRITIQCSCRL